MSAKFFVIAIGEEFFLNDTPKPSLTTPEPALNLTLCRKASAISYTVLAEAFLGEISYDPDIEPRILTVKEQQKLVKQVKDAKKAPKAKKPAKKAAKKAATKSAAKKPAKKAVKKSASSKNVPAKKKPGKQTAKKDAKKARKSR